MDQFGVEWIVDAEGCDAASLRSLDVMRRLFDELISELDLRTIGETHWHQFPVTGGITGLSLLAESHLAVHTFPEFNSLCLNLFCCVPRKTWDFESHLKNLLSAQSVHVRQLQREYGRLDEIAVIGSAKEAQ
jgi:S-adenosylmethionine decarboxylase